jgi:signal transduction histidine kinase
MRFGLDRMSRLVNTLLTLGRIEDMKNNTTIEPFDIGVALHEVIGPFDTKIREKGIDIYCNISQEIIIRSNREMVKSIFEILFDNAVKYTDARGRISVELRREKRVIVFCVGNSGKGISKADLPKVFERFYRSDASRNSEGGHGLGLAIAKETLMKLGGKISVKSGNGWTTFVIEF